METEPKSEQTNLTNKQKRPFSIKTTFIAIFLNDARAIKTLIDRHETFTVSSTRDTLSNGPIRRSVGLSVRDRQGPKDGLFRDFQKKELYLRFFITTCAHRKRLPITSKILLRIPRVDRFPRYNPRVSTSVQS